MKIVFGLQLIGLVALFVIALPRDDEYRMLLANIDRLNRQIQYDGSNPISADAIRDLKIASDAYRDRKSREYHYLLLFIALHLGITVLTPIKSNLIQKN